MENIQKGYILTAKIEGMKVLFYFCSNGKDTMLFNGFGFAKIFPSVSAARSKIRAMQRQHPTLIGWKAQFIS